MATHTALQHDRGTLETIFARRAVRSYKPDKVDASTLHALLEAAVQAPTAMHREPWAFVVIQDTALLKRLSDQAKVLAREATGPLADPDFNIFYDAGTLIVICGRSLGPFVTADCWLAAENLMLAACAMGLGTCCIGFAVPVLNTATVKRELGIPPNVAAVAPVIVGMQKGVTPLVPRKAPEVLRWIGGATHRRGP